MHRGLAGKGRRRGWVGLGPGCAGLAALLLLAAGPRARAVVLAPGEETKVVIREEDGWSALTVQADEAGLYLVRTHGEVDTMLHAFDAGGRYLGENDDVFGLDAALALPLAAGATVRIEASLSPGAATRPSPAPTRVSFRQLDLPTGEAKVGGAARGVIGPGRPAPFTFTAPESGAVLISTFVTGPLDTVLHVYDEDGVLLGFNDDRAPGDLSSAVALRIERGRRYLALVSGFSGRDEGAFALEVSDIEPLADDDFPDDLDAPIREVRRVPAAGLAVNGDWETWGDVDIVDLKFDVAGLYRLEARSRADMTLTVHDRSGRAIRADDDSGPGRNSRLLIEARAGETLRARVRPLNPLDRGPWHLTAARVGNALPTPVRRDIGGGRVHGLAICVADAPPPGALVDTITDAWNFRRFMIGSLGADEDDVRILVADLDRHEDAATVPRIRDELRDLAARVAPEDTVFVLYSGHGSAKGRGAWLHPEARPFPSGMLRQDLDRIRARTVVRIDACNSGGFVESLAAPERWVVASSRGDEGSHASFEGQPEKTGGSLFLACFLLELMYRAETACLVKAFHRASNRVTALAPQQRPKISAPGGFPLTAPPALGADMDGWTDGPPDSGSR